jgi:hypothetical protein
MHHLHNSAPAHASTARAPRPCPRQQSRPLLRLGQRMLDPLQQFLADGCHLTRDPLPAIQAAGFEGVEASRFQVDGMSLIAPHVAGIARA